MGVDVSLGMVLAPGVRRAMPARMEQVRPEPQVKAPTLLVWGERDALIPFSNAQDHLKAPPDSRLISFPVSAMSRRRKSRTGRHR